MWRSFKDQMQCWRQEDFRSCIENKLSSIYWTKFRVPLDRETLKDYRVFDSKGFLNDLVFEHRLTPANKVVKTSDSKKLSYVLSNNWLEYKVIHLPMKRDHSLKWLVIHVWVCLASQDIINCKRNWHDHQREHQCYKEVNGRTPTPLLRAMHGRIERT